MKMIMLLAVAALLAAGCAPTPPANSAATSQNAQTSNAGCTTTRDANNNVSTVCP
jgi:outer membrane biogenesis lipoprotein LolB